MSAVEVEVDTPDPVTLVGDDVYMAQNAVRRHLSEVRAKYRREVRRGNDHYAESRADQFDRYLDLYERLGGDPDTVPDVDAAPDRGEG